MKIPKAIIFLSITLGQANSLFAESKIYSDGVGLPAGSSYQVGDRTLYQDSLNLPAASAQKNGDTTFYSNSLNLPVGSSKSSGPDPFGALDDPKSPLNYKTKSLYD